MSSPIKWVRDENYREIFSTNTIVTCNPTSLCLIFTTDVVEPKEDGTDLGKVVRKIQVEVFMSPELAKDVARAIRNTIRNLKKKTKPAAPEKGPVYT